MNKKHNERCKYCKEAIYKLLQAAFGEVEKQFDLNLPCNLNDYKTSNSYKDLEEIYSNLQTYRGFKNFVKAKKLPKIDYFVYDPEMIVEFDESQHFTQPRAISLKNYPSYLKLGFDKDKWLQRCEDLNRKDNDPPYRDEQRAWYDTLRDFIDIPTVRLYPEEVIWCKLNCNNEEDVNWFKKYILNKLNKPIH